MFESEHETRRLRYSENSALKIAQDEPEFADDGTQHLNVETHLLC